MQPWMQSSEMQAGMQEKPKAPQERLQTAQDNHFVSSGSLTQTLAITTRNQTLKEHTTLKVLVTVLIRALCSSGYSGNEFHFLSLYV